MKTCFIILIEYFKISALPFYTFKLTNIRNIKKFIKSDHIIFVNESTAFSSIFLLIFLKKITTKETHLFAMGLF